MPGSHAADGGQLDEELEHPPTKHPPRQRFGDVDGGPAPQAHEDQDGDLGPFHTTGAT